MKFCFKISIIIGLFIIIGIMGTVAAVEKSPAKVASALTIKLSAFEKGISGDIVIYVMGEPDVATELKAAIGSEIGTGKLKEVKSGDGLPSEKPSILFVGEKANVGEAIGYTRGNKVLSVSGNPALITEGVSLGFGLGDDGKPKIFLNITASKEEGLDWNPAIMKIATIVQ